MNEQELIDALAELGLPKETITHIITLYMRSRNTRNLYKIAQCCAEAFKQAKIKRNPHAPKRKIPPVA